MLWGLDEHWTALKRLEDVKQAYDIGLRETPFEIYRQTGYAVSEFLDGILPALLQICVVQAACTVLGAGIGAAIGAAFGGGVGAVPGGLYGAEAGFSVGATILGWMGLGFLFLAVGSNLVSMIVLVRQAVMRAWHAADTSPDQRGHEVRQAGQDLARAMGTFMLLILQAIVAWVLKRGIDRAPELYADLRKSKLGDGFTSWVEQNLDRLMKDSKLRPRQAEGSNTKAPEPTAQTPSQLAQRRQDEEVLPTQETMQSSPLGRVVSSHTAVDPGPLEPGIAGTFAGGRYTVVELKQDTTLYRAGAAGRPLGQFFDTEPPNGVLQARIDKAVLPRWPGGATSPIDTSYAIKIPKGTQVYVGEVGSQSGFYVGGTQQVIVLKPWAIDGVEVLASSPIK